jgi:AraC-like DNA-binding protein
MARMDFDNVAELLDLAERSAYRVRGFAIQLRISPRQLQRYTRKAFGQSPQKWLHQQRLIVAADKLKRLRSVKAVSFLLGFKQVSHFSREFKMYHGVCPTAFIARAFRSADL